MKKCYNKHRLILMNGGEIMKNMGANYNHRVTLRLNEEQYNFIIDCSNLLGVSPSDYIRMTINSGMVALKNKNLSINVTDMISENEVGTNENVKTDSNNQL